MSIGVRRGKRTADRAGGFFAHAGDGTAAVGVLASAKKFLNLTTLALTVLFVALVVASLYCVHYGVADSAIAVGEMSIKKDGKVLLSMNVTEGMEARINYLGKKITGTLEPYGTQNDAAVFRVSGIEFSDGSDATDADMYIGMPRSGVKGNLVGPWFVYYTRPAGGATQSSWALVHEDGSADVGERSKANVTMAQRSKLISWSEGNWTWERDGKCLALTSH